MLLSTSLRCPARWRSSGGSCERVTRCHQCGVSRESSWQEVPRASDGAGSSSHVIKCGLSVAECGSGPSYPGWGELGKRCLAKGRRPGEGELQQHWEHPGVFETNSQLLLSGDISHIGPRPLIPRETQDRSPAALGPPAPLPDQHSWGSLGRKRLVSPHESQRFPARKCCSVKKYSVWKMFDLP